MSPRNHSVRSFSSTPWNACLLLSAVLLALSGGHAALTRADDSAAAKTELVGSRVNVKLRSGKTLEGVTVEEARPGKLPGTIIRLRVFNPATKSRTTLAAAAVEQVATADGQIRLVYDKRSKALAPPDAATKKTSVRLWPELSDEDQQAALVKRKEFLKKVAEHFSALNMRLYETKYFLLLSSLPPQLAATCQPQLDAMHEELCKAYAVQRPDKLWLGKAVVVAFGNKDDFMQFEQVFFHATPPPNVQGAANQISTGEDVVGCYCGDDPAYFAHVLVHETTHGFNHRYKSAEQLPNWLDEGIADWVAMSVVKANKRAFARVTNSVQQARQRGNLGGDFFTAEHISAWQYGIASSMVNFLLKCDRKAFRRLIDEIKLGAKWEDALHKTYRLTPQELAWQYGRSMGIPNLAP
jgi:hypothetical protein